MDCEVCRNYAMTLPSSNALDLLRWLGLPRQSHGVHAAADVALRCERLLWPERRNHGSALPGFEEANCLRLKELAQAAPDGAEMWWG